MSITLRDILTFSFAVIMGYCLYPLLNGHSQPDAGSNIHDPASTRLKIAPASSDSLLPTSAEQAASLAMAKTAPQGSEVIVTQQDMEEQLSDRQQAFEVKDALPDAADNSALASDEPVLDSEQRIVQHELESWTEQHKADLHESLKLNVPVSIVDGMLEQIAIDNDFLDKPSIKQDPVVDEQWAYTMEQELRDVIQQHALANQLELFNVVCKQLTCELTGKELVAGTWQQVFIAVFSYIVKSGKNLADDNNGKNVSYLEDDLVYFYTQFVFMTS